MSVTTDVGKFAIFPKHLQGKLSHGATVLYLALFFYADQDGVCWPGVERLARDVRVSPRSVQRWLKELVNADALSIAPRRTANGDADTNQYHLHLAPKVVTQLHHPGDTAVTTPGDTAVTLTRTNGTRPNEGERTRFSKPAPSEVRAYMNSRGWPDAQTNSEKFCDHYESKGWLIGKSPMKDWQASVRTWEKNTEGVSKPLTKEQEELINR